jgi:hypothetical protein
MKTPKSFFNYRVILDRDANGHPFYSIRGVHYKDFGETIEGWDAEPLVLTFSQGDSISGYLNSLERAAIEPVLMVNGDKLEDIGNRPAEMFVSRSTKYPACLSTPKE